jgi:hypothetical protein
MAIDRAATLSGPDRGRCRSASPPAIPATAAATVMVGRPALSAAWRTAVPVCLSLPTTCSGVCAAAPARVPFRELPVLRELLVLREFPLLPERAVVERPDPFRDCAVPRLDDLDCVLLAPLVEMVPVVFARLRDVRGFGAA